MDHCDDGEDEESKQRMTLLPSSSVLGESSETNHLPSAHANYGTSTSQHEIDDGTSDKSGSNGSVPSRNEETTSTQTMSLWNMTAVLSTSFGYGCIMTTLFLITLPIECERISIATHGATPKSIALGIFVAIAGLTQLVSPLVGRLSDTYEPPRVVPKRQEAPSPSTTTTLLVNHHHQYTNNENNNIWAEVGQRMPYHICGGILSVLGLLGQMFSSDSKLWIRYGFAFFFSMVGLNIQYAMMIAFIPDQIPPSQTGIANGILALLMVTGSLFGFGLFHTFLSQTVSSMYGLYLCIVVCSSILTGTHAHERDAELAMERMQSKLQRHSQQRIIVVENDSHSSHDEAPVSPSPRRTSYRNHHHHLARRAHHSAKKAVRKAVLQAQQIVLPPTLIVQSVLLDPVRKLTWKSIRSCYTIDVERHHDFFVVTVSRLCYYCGMSVQTFFLYFVHDIIGVTQNPEAAVATLAILGQCSGALTCYPVGVVSDYVLGGRRTPFVYAACLVLGTATLILISATTMKEMRIFCVILGAANGVYLTMETSMAVDTLPNDLVEDVDVGNAQLLGIWGVAAFLGSALGPMIGGPLLYIFGSSTTTTTTTSTMESTAGQDDKTTEVSTEVYTLQGYAIVLTLSAFYFYASALTLRFIKYHHE